MTILGPGGAPLSSGEPSPQPKPQPKEITLTDFCRGVIAAYAEQLSKNGVDPVNALIEMGVQAPQTIVEYIQYQAKGNTALAEEPLRHLLEEVSNMAREFGFRMMFQLQYAGGEEDGTGTEPDTGCGCGNNESDTCSEVQGCCYTENQGNSEVDGPASTDGEPEVSV